MERSSKRQRASLDEVPLRPPVLRRQTGADHYMYSPVAHVPVQFGGTLDWVSQQPVATQDVTLSDPLKAWRIRRSCESSMTAAETLYRGLEQIPRGMLAQTADPIEMKQ